MLNQLRYAYRLHIIITRLLNWLDHLFDIVLLVLHTCISMSFFLSLYLSYHEHLDIGIASYIEWIANIRSGAHHSRLSSSYRSCRWVPARSTFKRIKIPKYITTVNLYLHWTRLLDKRCQLDQSRLYIIHTLLAKFIPCLENCRIICPLLHTSSFSLPWISIFHRPYNLYILRIHTAPNQDSAHSLRNYRKVPLLSLSTVKKVSRLVDLTDTLQDGNIKDTYCQ